MEALSKPIPSRSCFKTNVEKRTGPNNQMLTQCVIEKENIEEVARAVDQDAVVANEDSVDSAYHIQTPNEADNMG